MDFMREVADTIARETMGFLAGAFPFLMLGLLGLYMLWLLVGYLRVSQVGIGEGHERQVVALPGGHRPTLAGGTADAPDTAATDTAATDTAATDTAATKGEPAQLEITPGLPYCPVDRLQYPASARFCTRCERDLVIDCTNCGATLRAGDASCYRCGTPTVTADDARPH